MGPITSRISTADNTIRRRSFVTAGESNDAHDFNLNLDATTGEWDGFTIDTFSGLGAHTTDPCS